MSGSATRQVAVADIGGTHARFALADIGADGTIDVAIAPLLRGSEFAARFTAKGRLAARLEAVPVHILIHSNPGLLGAAKVLA